MVSIEWYEETLAWQVIELERLISQTQSLHHIQYAVPNGLNPHSISFLNQERSAFDFGEFEEAIVLQSVKINNNEVGPALCTARPATATLVMFPSWPMRFYHSQRESSKSGETTDSGSAVNSLSSKAEGHLEPGSPISRNTYSDCHVSNQKHIQITQPRLEQQHKIEMASDSPTGASQSQPATKPSEKTLRRLAQNREAARKSRLRKKAYVQQLESSRIRLMQVEQDLHQARAQGLFMGGVGSACGNITSSGAAIFDMEYARWLDDEHRHISELRTGMQTNLSDVDLRIIVDGYVTHYDEIFRLKTVAAKSDVFHLITGMWTSPAERCFLWMSGFRPSELIKMLIVQLDPLTEQQLMGIYSLQHSSQQAEEALSQGLEQLQQTLINTISGGSVTNGMHHMAVALGKLTNLEGFVCQADNLRQQTLHQLCRILTVRQAARCFLVIGEYYARLRALGSLWTSRPLENMISDDNSWQATTDLQMIQSSQNQFSNF